MKKTLHRSWTRVRRSMHKVLEPTMSTDTSLPLQRAKQPPSPSSNKPHSWRARFKSPRKFFSTSSQQPTSLSLFLQEILANPRAIGAACPSSKQLGKAMVQPVLNQDGLILELGAGTGSITAAMLGSGIAPERLIVLERSKPMADYLRQRFPQLRVIEGDAAHLKKLLSYQRKHITTVVSSLPLRSLPSPLVRTILHQAHDVIGDAGLMVQFTYDLRGKNHPYQEKFFTRTASTLVWRNFPPARVDVFHPRIKQHHQE